MNINNETSQAIIFMQNMMTNMMLQLQKSNERAEKNEQLVNELMRMQHETAHAKSESSFPSVPSTTIHPSSVSSSSHQHSSTPNTSSVDSSSRISVKRSSSPVRFSTSPASSPMRNRSRSKAEKIVSSSIKLSREEAKIIKSERRKERDEEERYDSV